MIIGHGAEKAPWLHRADTGTPVRRKIRAERRGDPAAFGILQRKPVRFFTDRRHVYFATVALFL